MTLMTKCVDIFEDSGDMELNNMLSRGDLCPPHIEELIAQFEISTLGDNQSCL